jgi:hypothetical protein
LLERILAVSLRGDNDGKYDSVLSFESSKQGQRKKTRWIHAQFGRNPPGKCSNRGNIEVVLGVGVPVLAHRAIDFREVARAMILAVRTAAA